MELVVCMSVNVCKKECVCVCVCVWKRGCVCVCVCVTLSKTAYGRVCIPPLSFFLSFLSTRAQMRIIIKWLKNGVTAPKTNRKKRKRNLIVSFGNWAPHMLTSKWKKNVCAMHHKVKEQSLFFSFNKIDAFL